MVRITQTPQQRDGTLEAELESAGRARVQVSERLLVPAKPNRVAHAFARVRVALRRCLGGLSSGRAAFGQGALQPDAAGRPDMWRSN